MKPLNSGTPPLKAATDAFGDLKALNGDLRKYLNARKLLSFQIPTSKLPDVTVDVRALTPGERALIDMRMVSTRGVDDKTAATLYARAAKAAAPHMNDAVAQGWLAEMAYDAKRDDEADRLRRLLDERDTRLRRVLREWDRLVSETEMAALRSELAEQALRSLNGEAEGQPAF